MVQIVPAILATTEQEYRDKLSKLEESGLFENGWIQVDLMDGKFVPNHSIKPDVIKKYSSSFKIEAQLMVQDPESWVDDLIEAEVARIIFPAEAGLKIDQTIKYLKSRNIEVGVSLNPETSMEALEPFIGKIDLSLVMSVKPGFGGQEFIAGSIEKVRQINARWDIPIEVDGGISTEVVKRLVEAGADYLVIGSHLIEGNIDENLEHLWEAIH